MYHSCYKVNKMIVTEDGYISVSETTQPCRIQWYMNKQNTLNKNQKMFIMLFFSASWQGYIGNTCQLDPATLSFVYLYVVINVYVIVVLLLLLG